MKDSMYYFLTGFMSAFLIAMVIISYYPIHETEESCGNCGHKAWYFKIIE